MNTDTEKSPVEIVTTYSTQVDELSEAWTFVMDHLDKLGDDPSIHITPVFSYCEDHGDERYFEVTVMGRVFE